MIQSTQNITVIFDLGKVVLNWGIDSVLKSLNLNDTELGLLRKELFLHQDWQDMDHGKELETAVILKVCHRSTLSKDIVESALLAAKNSLQVIPESLSLMHEMVDNGIAIYCLSNMSRETYSHIKNKHFFTLFSDIIISGIEGLMKPNDDIFHLAIKRFNLTPSNTVFIDDTLANIKTAQRLGINGFHFKGSQSCYSKIRKLLV